MPNSNRASEPHGLFQSEPGKMNPSFREEDQEMAEELKPVVVGPPGYASPDPRTMSGRLVAVEEHPLSADIDPDYGAAVRASIKDDASPVVETDAYQSTMTPEDGLKAQAQKEAEELPENRDEWTKKHYQVQARALGLETSGSKAALKERVDEYEAAVEEAKEMKADEWISEIESAESADDLATLRDLYGRSGADFKTVDDAFASKQDEFSGNSEEDED